MSRPPLAAVLDEADAARVEGHSLFTHALQLAIQTPAVVQLLRPCSRHCTG